MKLKKKFKGITIVEMLISMLIFSIVASLATNMMINMQINNTLMEATNIMKSRDQMALNKIGKEINSSRMFIGRVTSDSPYQYGTDYYLPKIDLPSTFDLKGLKCQPLVKNSRVLPMIKGDLSFSPLDTYSPTDTSVARRFDSNAVGNSLLLASVTDSINCKYIDGITGAEKPRTLDLYTFSYYYLAKSSNLSDKNKKPYLFLMKWQSKYFIDYKKLNDTIGATKPDKIKDFFDSIKASKPVNFPNIAVEGVWNPQVKSECSTTAGSNYFYSLDNSSLGDRNCVTYKIPMQSNTTASLIDGYYNSLVYGVERNNDSSGQTKVPTYAIASTTDDGYPHGFEVMIGGSSSARQVFLRLVRKANRLTGQSVYAETVSLFQGADF